MILLDTHPLLLIDKFVGRLGKEAIFRFSRYPSASQVDPKSCDTLSVNGKDLCKGWLEATLDSLKPSEELALHSDVQVGRQRLHIPMVDFRSRSRAPEIERQILSFLSEDLPTELYIFDSGRSFHGYGSNLLQPDQWASFMGLLLLLNPRDEMGCIDSRWVGHRLVDGYATLRWSCNTDDYQYLPRLVDSHQWLDR